MSRWGKTIVIPYDFIRPKQTRMGLTVEVVDIDNQPAPCNKHSGDNEGSLEPGPLIYYTIMSLNYKS